MNNKNNRLSAAALICMLLSARVFATLTFFPAGTESGLVTILAVIFSTALQGLMLVPAVCLAKSAKTDILTLADSHGTAVGKAVTAGFLLYFIYESFYDIGSLAYFTDYFFSVNMPRLLTVFCCVFAAVYVAALDTAVIGRAAQMSLLGALLMLLVIAAGSFSDMDVTRFDLAVPDVSGKIWHAMLSETDRCECLVLFTFYAGSIKGDPAVAARRFIIAKAALICTVFGLVTAVTGSFAVKSPLPVFTLAASSENLITERCDAVFLLAWVFTGLVKLANLLHCASICLRRLKPDITAFGGAFAAGLVPAAAALPLLFDYDWEAVIRSEHSILLLILLAFLLPCILLSVSRHSCRDTADQALQ